MASKQVIVAVLIKICFAFIGFLEASKCCKKSSSYLSKQEKGFICLGREGVWGLYSDIWGGGGLLTSCLL